MTIPSTASEISYAGDDVSTEFAIPFKFDTTADIKVIRTDPDGNPEILSTGFSVTGGGGDTGDIELDDPLESGYVLTILDDPELTQPVDYIDNDAFHAETHEGALDRGVRISKRLNQLLLRSLRVVDGDPSVGDDMELPSVESRAGKYLVFDETTGAPAVATAIEVTTLTQAVVAGLLYPQTPIESSAGVTPTDHRYLPGNAKRYGAVGDGVANDTQAIKDCIDLYAATGAYIPAGTYLTDTYNFPVNSFQTHVYGDGPGRTILKQRNATGHVLAFPTGTNIHTVRLENFEILGHASSSSGHGIHIAAVLAQDPSNVQIRNLRIDGMGGCGIKCEETLFQTTIEHVWVGDCLDHQFDFYGGNTFRMVNCYALDVPTAGKAGYRIRAGSPMLISCNGINSGDYWGIFGELSSGTVAPATDDSQNTPCFPYLIGCNVEDFEVVGVYVKRDGPVLLGTFFTAPAAGSVRAILCTGANGTQGSLDRSDIFQTNGATWVNSLPVHTLTEHPPFSSVISATADQLTYRDNDAGTDRTLSTLRLSVVRQGRYAVSPYDLYARGTFRSAYRGTATLSAGTVAISFAGLTLPNLPDTTYGIFLTGNIAESFTWDSKATTGFTINSSNGGSTAVVDWAVIL